MTTTKKTKDVTPAAQDEKRKPIHTFAVDEIRISVWSRQVEVRGESRTFYSYTPERVYRDGYGKVGYTKSFEPGSGERLKKAIDQAEEYLLTLTHPETMLPSEERELAAAA